MNRVPLRLSNRRLAPLLRSFSPREREVLGRVVEACAELCPASRKKVNDILLEAACSIPRLIDSMGECPPLDGRRVSDPQEAGLYDRGRAMAEPPASLAPNPDDRAAMLSEEKPTGETALIEALCRRQYLPIEFSLPTRALLGRTLIVARVNFLKSLERCVRPLCQESERAQKTGTRNRRKPSAGGSKNGNGVIAGGGGDPGQNGDKAVEESDRKGRAAASESLRAVHRVLQEILDDAIFCRLAEELLVRVVSNQRNEESLRRRAASNLVNMWDDRDGDALESFPSVLLSAWKARRRVRAIYGTLFGVQEVLSLTMCECDNTFVNFFTREQVTPPQAEAFLEFLFALSYEELQETREYMKQQGLNVISRDEVQRLIRRPLAEPDKSEAPQAHEVFTSYTRRRLRAEYRALSNTPGPQKTAEGYIMEALLRGDLG